MTAPLATESKDNHLEVPNKLKKLNKEAAAGASPKNENSVWGFLGIKPCGELDWRSFLESQWTSRNGHAPIDLIGQAVDAWEAGAGEKPRGCAPLFRALATLRSGERNSAIQEHEPIRKLAPEEIPA